jgi:hypothetical protein
MDRFLLHGQAFDKIGSLHWTRVGLEALRHTGHARATCFVSQQIIEGR